MTDKISISWHRAELSVSMIGKENPKIFNNIVNVYGIPRGGCPLAVMFSMKYNLPIIEDESIISERTLVVDDIADSGKTINKFENNFKFVLVKKSHSELINKLIGSPIEVDGDTWVEFPWEKKNETIEDNVTRLLTYIGEDPSREGLIDTPKRVVRSYSELYGGYGMDINKILERTFSSEGYDEMIIVKDIQFYSMCEHHMLPFFGKAHVGYIPNIGENGKIVGLSKIPRVVEALSRRLQNQERLTFQIADAISSAISPKGVAVVMEGTHFCMVSRGIKNQSASMTTSQLRGVFKVNMDTREEFMRLIR